MQQINKKQKFKKTSDKLKTSVANFKQRLKKSKPKNQQNEADSVNNKKDSRQKMHFPKLTFSKNKFSKNNNRNSVFEVETPSPSKSLPKGLKVIEKYPLYEPFAQVVIIQDPKTGESKYILDELQLDSMERGIYNRILEMLLAEMKLKLKKFAITRFHRV